MAELDTGHGREGLTRRDFLAATAAATVAGCAFEVMWDPERAAAYENDPAYDVFNTTCPYCSASCGQRVVVETATQKVVDVYGDFESPMNSGGLCAKGAGSHQLVTNTRRIGAWAGSHPVNDTFAYDNTYADGIAYVRTGNDPWTKVSLDAALSDIATRLISARNSDTAGWDPATGKYNSKGVAFFGSSHLNNEPNYVYRKIIATFGTSNVEHQARI
ncbi:MAG: twin-arginine translocation signal domain-containing protein [Coriobacteriales bacterium]|nr:twin-arginine translocation signal domain-containing protein [Coriobacteriales bacterium]